VFVRRYGEVWKERSLRTENSLHVLPLNYSAQQCQEAVAALCEDDQLVSDLRGRVPFPLKMRSLFFGYWRFVEGHEYRLIYLEYQRPDGVSRHYTVYVRPHQTWSSLCLQVSIVSQRFIIIFVVVSFLIAV
jgi:hypothetical protein